MTTNTKQTFTTIAPAADKQTLGENYVSPREPRYGIALMIDILTKPQAFGSWVIKANTIRQFIPFQGEVIRGTHSTVDQPRGEVLATHERLPGDQITDLTPKWNFIALDALTGVSIPDINAIAQVLLNAPICSKYPISQALDSGGMEWDAHKCGTCLKAYLETDVSRGIQQLDDRLKPIAVAAASAILGKLTAALQQVRSEVDQTLREVDDEKQPKTRLYAYDYLQIRHLHGDEPEYRTNITRQNTAKELAAALRDALGGVGAPAAQPVDIASVVAAEMEKQKDAIRAEMRAEMLAGATAQTQDEPQAEADYKAVQAAADAENQPEVSMSVADFAMQEAVLAPNGIVGKVTNKPFGKITLTFEDGSQATYPPNDLAKIE